MSVPLALMPLSATLNPRDFDLIFFCYYSVIMPIHLSILRETLKLARDIFPPTSSQQPT